MNPADFAGVAATVPEAVVEAVVTVFPGAVEKPRRMMGARRVVVIGEGVVVRRTEVGWRVLRRVFVQALGVCTEERAAAVEKRSPEVRIVADRMAVVVATRRIADVPIGDVQDAGFMISPVRCMCVCVKIVGFDEGLV
jgi:hypothetical protein